eukprot:4423007-Pyramimonas_sp.AAC.1
MSSAEYHSESTTAVESLFREFPTLVSLGGHVGLTFTRSTQALAASRHGKPKVGSSASASRPAVAAEHEPE